MWTELMVRLCRAIGTNNADQQGKWHDRILKRQQDRPVPIINYDIQNINIKQFQDDSMEPLTRWNLKLMQGNSPYILIEAIDILAWWARPCWNANCWIHTVESIFCLVENLVAISFPKETSHYMCKLATAMPTVIRWWSVLVRLAFLALKYASTFVGARSAHIFLRKLAKWGTSLSAVLKSSVKTIKY